VGNKKRDRNEKILVWINEWPPSDRGFLDFVNKFLDAFSFPTITDVRADRSLVEKNTFENNGSMLIVSRLQMNIHTT